MIGYYYLLLSKDAQKAMEFAQTMSLNKNVLRLNDWRDRCQTATDFVLAESLIDNNKPNSALKILDSIKSKEYLYDNNIRKKTLLLKAHAADANQQTQKAYDGLALSYSKLPEDEIRLSLIAYGAKLGLTEQQVLADVWKLRDATAIQATSFKLKNTLTKDTASIIDYKGKVVLLTYWFPSCGFCIEEFPHFENVIKKINSQHLAYVGLNVLPFQNNLVIAMMKLNNYSFIPLEDSPERKKGTLPTFGQPTNYLIDQTGKITFSNFIINEQNEHTLELMITELLNRKADNNNSAVPHSTIIDTAIVDTLTKRK